MVYSFPSFYFFLFLLVTKSWLFAAPWTAAYQASLFFAISQSLLKLMPLSQWCHPAISSSVDPFSPCLHFFPASGSFLMSWLFTPDGQSIAASASASVLLVNIQDWFPLLSTGLISLQSKGLSRVFSSTTVQMHQFFAAHPSLWSNSHIHTGKNHSFDYMDLCQQSNVYAFKYSV